MYIFLIFYVRENNNHLLWLNLFNSIRLPECNNLKFLPKDMEKTL